MTPPNFVYQRWLEDKLPARVPATRSIGKHRPGEVQKTRLSLKNTLVKLCVDQTMGHIFNTALFILLFGMARGKNFDLIYADLRNVSNTPAVFRIEINKLSRSFRIGLSQVGVCGRRSACSTYL